MRPCYSFVRTGFQVLATRFWHSVFDPQVVWFGQLLRDINSGQIALAGSRADRSAKSGRVLLEFGRIDSALLGPSYDIPKMCGNITIKQWVFDSPFGKNIRGARFPLCFVTVLIAATTPGFSVVSHSSNITQGLVHNSTEIRTVISIEASSHVHLYEFENSNQVCESASASATSLRNAQEAISATITDFGDIRAPSNFFSVS